MHVTQVFDGYMRKTLSSLAGKVEDLEDIKFVMEVLHEVRSHRALSLVPFKGRWTH